MLYYRYSDYLVEKYGKKVYKIPINLDLTCPNRDGICSNGGCTFCGDKGAGFESQQNSLSIKEQFFKNVAVIAPKYKPEKYIVFLQNFSNTYMTFERLRATLYECIFDDVVEVCLSTRPDCLTPQMVELFDSFMAETGVFVSVELGLQSANHRTLQKINRGHTLAEFINACILLSARNIPITAHIILNLPFDDTSDLVECAKILSALNVSCVKIHSLFILRGTPIGDMFEGGELTLITKDEYIERCGQFLCHLKPEIAIGRLLARAPKEDTLFCNFDLSWWRLQEEIEDYMTKNDLFQGKYCNYLDGGAWRKRFGEA